MFPMSSYVKGCLLALSACSFWSCNILFAKILSEKGTGPIAICLYRWIIASSTLWIFYHQSIRADWVNARRHWKFLCITGVLGIGSINTLIYYAAHSTTAMNMGLISTVGPLFIILFSYLLLKEYLGIKKIIGSVIAIIGILLLISKGQLGSLFNTSFSRGDLLMIGAMIAAGIYSALIKKTPASFRLTSFLFYIFVIGAISLIPFYFITETHYIPHYDGKAWGMLLFLSLGPSLLAFLFWSQAIHLVGANTVAIIYFSLPLLSSLLAIIVLKEALETYHLISFGFILVGLLYSLMVWKRKTSLVNID